MELATPRTKLSRTQFWAFLAVTFALLLGSLRWNIFRIDPAQVTENILLADCYVVPAMEFYAEGPALQRDFGEIKLLGGDGKYSPYYMQVGLQRIVFSGLSPRSSQGVDRAIPLLETLVAGASALTFTAFLAVVEMEFGLLCAGLTLLLLAFSNWLVIFAPDLFWVSATFFMPFVLAWLLGDPARPRNQRRLLAACFTLVCLIKCLCGFDYTTNIFAAVAVPFLYYGLRRGVMLRAIAARVLGYGALSVVAFLAAIALQIMQFSFVQRDTNNSLSSFLTEVRRRTLSNGEGISSRYDDAVLNLLHRLHVSTVHDPGIERWLVPMRPLLRYFRYLSMGAVTVRLPFRPLQLPIGLFVAGFLVAFFIWRQRSKRKMTACTDRGAALMWSSLAALAISHFWVVAANGHMTHTFFNAIVFYIPFLPMAYVALSFGIASALRRVGASRVLATRSA